MIAPDPALNYELFNQFNRIFDSYINDILVQGLVYKPVDLWKFNSFISSDRNTRIHLWTLNRRIERYLEDFKGYPITFVGDQMNGVTYSYYLTQEFLYQMLFRGTSFLMLTVGPQVNLDAYCSLIDAANEYKQSPLLSNEFVPNALDVLPIAILATQEAETISLKQELKKKTELEIPVLRVYDIVGIKEYIDNLDTVIRFVLENNIEIRSLINHARKLYELIEKHESLPIEIIRQYLKDTQNSI